MVSKVKRCSNYVGEKGETTGLTDLSIPSAGTFLKVVR
jgi:hypothetical protein